MSGSGPAGRDRWHPVYVALGSNLDDPRRRVGAAIEALATLPRTRLELRSGIWRTPPFGPVPQPDFANAVAALLTSLPLEEFFAELRALESRLGREPPRERWGPRHIDLDLLAFADCVHEGAALSVPHPGIPERAFVLLPLAEIAPSLRLPRFGRVADLAARVDARGVALWK